jgi:hypothetical protein
VGGSIAIHRFVRLVQEIGEQRMESTHGFLLLPDLSGV